MELIYYWINDDNCIREQGFCFSPEYNVLMEKSEDGIYEVKIAKKKAFNVFASEVISNLTVLVGDNGAGKSTFLRNILNLNCYSLEKADKEEYRKHTEKRNEEYKKLIILRENNQLRLYTNIYKKEIRVPEIFVEDETAFYISDSERNIAGENIVNNSEYCAFTKFYISNSYFDDINGMGSHGTLSDLAITPARLSFIASTFFEFIYPDKLDREIENTEFDKYSKWLKRSKSSDEFQQICDLIFYNFLISTGAIDDYEGIVQTQIRVQIRSAENVIIDAEKIYGEDMLLSTIL